MGKWVERHWNANDGPQSQYFWWGSAEAGEPHQNIATVPFPSTFPCFFQEIYNKDASFSIHLKILFISMRGLQCHKV
jgi:hypothetical protein